MNDDRDKNAQRHCEVDRREAAAAAAATLNLVTKTDEDALSAVTDGRHGTLPDSWPSVGPPVGLSVCLSVRRE